MTFLQAAVLGLVQGLCEFLPVSSSGHLVLLQRMFGITEGALFFSVMLHIGTLFAVLIAFRRTIWKILCHPFQKLLGYVVLATLPTVVITLIFGSWFESMYDGSVLGVSFLITSLILWLSEAVSRRNAEKKRPIKGLAEMRPMDAVAIGCMQGVAVLPGVSRSGSTISAALMCGLDRSFAAEFSFLMSIPAILGSALLEGIDLVQAGFGSVEWGPVLVGMAVAFAAGWFSINWMLKLIKKGGLKWFGVYTAVLGALIIFDGLVTHLYF